MPETSLTGEEVAELQRLLAKVQADGYFWPDEETMHIAHATVSYWAPELVIFNKRGEVLLARYDGGADLFAGLWHIPGGYNRWDEDEGETCNRIARRELGCEVKPYRIYGAKKWKTHPEHEDGHPYGRPFSVYVGCTPVGEIVETDTLRFFPLDDLPESEMVKEHFAFLMTIDHDGCRW